MAHHPLPGAASQPDLYRDTWVRYLGYANEVGESFRALIPKALVWATYGVATAYVTADAADKGQKASELDDCLLEIQLQEVNLLRIEFGRDDNLGYKTRAAFTYLTDMCRVLARDSFCREKTLQSWANQDGPGRRTDITVAVVDTFVWQALASVAIPGFTINRLCAASLYMMGRVTRWPLPVRKWATTAIGLSAIPVIITPIDRSVDILLDSSLRKLYGTKAEKPEESETR